MVVFKTLDLYTATLCAWVFRQLIRYLLRGSNPREIYFFRFFKRINKSGEKSVNICRVSCLQEEILPVHCFPENFFNQKLSKPLRIYKWVSLKFFELLLTKLAFHRALSFSEVKYFFLVILLDIRPIWDGKPCKIWLRRWSTNLRYLRYSFCREKCFKSDFTLTFLKKKLKENIGRS